MYRGVAFLKGCGEDLTKKHRYKGREEGCRAVTSLDLKVHVGEFLPYVGRVQKVEEPDYEEF